MSDFKDSLALSPNDIKNILREHVRVHAGRDLEPGEFQVLLTRDLKAGEILNYPDYCFVALWDKKSK